MAQQFVQLARQDGARGLLFIQLQLHVGQLCLKGVQVLHPRGRARCTEHIPAHGRGMWAAPLPLPACSDGIGGSIAPARRPMEDAGLFHIISNNIIRLNRIPHQNKLNKTFTKKCLEQIFAWRNTPGN